MTGTQVFLNNIDADLDPLPLATSNRLPRLTLVLAVMSRATVLILLLSFVHTILTLGTPISAIAIGVIMAVVVGANLSLSKLAGRGFISITLALAGLIFGAIALIARAPFPSEQNSLFGFVLAEHLWMMAACSFAALISTFAAGRSRTYAIAEVVGILLFLLTTLAPHRGFHLDQPKFINLLAWNWSVDPLVALLVIGTLIATFSLWSLYLNTTLVLNRTSLRFTTQLSTRNFFVALGLVLTFFGVIYAASWQLYGVYSQRAATVVANGVGAAAAEGDSPLGFESALGGTSQPAGIVRLENEYPQNPFSPMLYLREQALSTIDGFELKVAAGGFDTDVPNTKVGQSFVREPDKSLDPRHQLTASVFLVGKQSVPFAVDFPISITPLRPPDRRFTGAYRAISVAPTYQLKDLVGIPVGNPEWTADQWRHYLEPHHDPRYMDKAISLTQEVPDPVGKAGAIVAYLSNESTYTLTPMHEKKPGEDPVAPYLFGDLRGYCVHFAHATVFMLRALGIPARIGTGYLTDMSQAKDGHMLLRMSDRHAWAEVYIRGKGWVPFDTQPQKVESHADTKVDQEVLEELMGLLGPGEEILPETTAKDEPGLIERPDLSAWLNTALVPTLALLLLIFTLTKGWLWYAWYFVRKPRQRLRWSYLALVARLTDLGLRRLPGETRNEYGHRLQLALAGSDRSLSLVPSLLCTIYGDALVVPEDSISASRQDDLRLLKALPLWRRLLAFLSPSSLFSFLTGELA